LIYLRNLYEAGGSNARRGGLQLVHCQSAGSQR